MSDFPRRNQMQQWVPAERMIYDVMQQVEGMGADVRLTDAVILLGKAKNRVADFVDGVTGDSGAQERAGEADVRPRHEQQPNPVAVSSDGEVGSPVASPASLGAPASDAVRVAVERAVTQLSRMLAGGDFSRSQVGEPLTEELALKALEAAFRAYLGDAHPWAAINEGSATDFDPYPEETIKEAFLQVIRRSRTVRG